MCRPQRSAAFILVVSCSFQIQVLFTMELAQVVSSGSSLLVQKKLSLIIFFIFFWNCNNLDKFHVCVSKFAFPLFLADVGLGWKLLFGTLDMDSSWQELLHFELRQSAFCRCLGRQNWKSHPVILSSFILSDSDEHYVLLSNCKSFSTKQITVSAHFTHCIPSDLFFPVLAGSKIASKFASNLKEAHSQPV